MSSPGRSTAGEKTGGGLSKRRWRRHSHDGNVDEPAKLIEMESVEIEAEVPAEENEPVETIEQNDKPEAPAFEDDEPSS